MTIKLRANDAILILICSYVGTLYGGSRTAILLNIPGTAANAASCADGHALALHGEAGRAIGIATSGAFTSVLFGVLCLATFTPLLAEVALKFGAFEFFWLALFGVTMSGSLVGKDPLKGWLMGAWVCSSPRSARTVFMPTTASPSAGASFPAASPSSRRWSGRSASPKS